VASHKLSGRVIPIKDNIPTDRMPVVTLALIIVNVVVYLLAVANSGSLISGPAPHELAAVPSGLTPGASITSLFVQGSIVQLLGNMLFLWIFGSSLEDAMGPIRFLAFYLVAGLIALGIQVALDPGTSAPTAGAAGAIAAVIGGYLRIYPRGRVLSLVLIVFFFGVLEVPVLVMLGLWLAMQAVFGNGAPAYVAHAVTLGLGFATAGWLCPRRKPMPPTAAAYR
jgi:membrane associated rhomboid family serine protease